MTMPQRTQQEIEALLPFYVNGTLDTDEIEQVEATLGTSGEMQEAVHEMRTMQHVWTTRETLAPAPHVREVLLQTIEPRSSRLLTWAWQACLLVIVAVLVWYAVSPGIVLRWTVDPAVAETYTAFVVYRQVEGAAPEQMAVLPVEDQTTFVFVDSLVRPDREYAYRVVAMDAQGHALATLSAYERGRSALFYQVLTLAVAVLIGLALAHLVMPLLRVSPRLSSVRL